MPVEILFVDGTRRRGILKGNFRTTTFMLISLFLRLRPNSTYLVTPCLDTTRRVRLVEPMHFGCVELVEQHGSTRSSRRARHVERVVSYRDVT